MKITKRLSAAFLVLVLVLSMLPVTAFAAGGDYATRLLVEKKSDQIVDVKWMVQTQNDAVLKTTNSILFKYDNTKYDMLTNSDAVITTKTMSDNLFSDYLDDETYEQNVTILDTPKLWGNSGIYAAAKGDWTFVLINLATGNATARKTYTTETALAVVHLKLKSGTVAELPIDSIALATKDEANACAQNGVVVFSGADEVAYVYGSTEGADTLTTTPAVATGDGVSFAKPTPAHEHIWATTLTHDETYHWYVCTGEGNCPDGNVKGKAEHSYDKLVKNGDTRKSAATCTSDAVYYKSCVCGVISTNDADTFTDEGSATGHTYNREVVSDDTLKTAATCTDAAVYYKSCVCGAVSTNDADTFTSGAPLGHDYTKQTKTDAYLKDTAKKCTEHNTYWYACSRCDASAKDDTNASDKFYNGSATGNHLFNKEVADDAHKVPGTGADCKHVVKYYYDCAYCGTTSTDQSWESGAVGPHSVNESDWKKDNTHHWHECTLCNEVISKAAHQFLDGSNTCSTCGFACTHASKTLVTGTPAACNVAGTKDYYRCNQCGAKFLNEEGTKSVTEADLIISALKHTGGTATCNKKAVCDLCGNEYGELDSNNHATGGQEVWVTDDTVIASTQHKKAWSCCGKVTVPTEKHEWDSTGKCTECNYQCKHNGGGTDATCIAKAKCGICGQEYGDFGSHNLTKTDAKAPTCTAEGNNAYWTCSVCHKVFKDNEGTATTIETSAEDEKLDMVDHNLTKTAAKAATCVAEGNNDYWICSVCKGVFKDADGKQTTSVADETLGKDLTKHVGGTTLKHDDKQHWYECNSCHQPNGAKVDHASAGANVATCLKKAKCDTCGVEYGDLAACANFKQAYNDKEHWQFCTLCGKVKDGSKEAHDLKQVGDSEGGYTKCDKCDYRTGGNAHDGDHGVRDANEWLNNDTHHWNHCNYNNCTTHMNEAPHTYTETVIKAATATEDGLKVVKCSVCGYMQQVVIPKTGGTTPGGNGGTGGGFPTKDNNKTNNTGKVESQKTFDGGIALYVGLSVLSLTGSALVIRKKKEF